MSKVWTKQEEAVLFQAMAGKKVMYAPKAKEIARLLPGRTPEAIRRHWLLIRWDKPEVPTGGDLFNLQRDKIIISRQDGQNLVGLNTKKEVAWEIFKKAQEAYEATLTSVREQEITLWEQMTIAYNLDRQENWQCFYDGSCGQHIIKRRIDSCTSSP